MYQGVACRRASTKLWGILFSSIAKQQLRRLSLYEFQSYDLLRRYNVPVPRGKVARTPQEVRTAAGELGGKCFLKPQVLNGSGRKGDFDSGLDGGIQIVNTPEESEKIASKMLNHLLTTKQTNGDGLTFTQVYVTEVLQFEEEWYLAMTIDRENYTPIIILSKSGGIDVAKEHPKKLSIFHFKYSEGITPELLAHISQCLDTSSEELKNLENILNGMYKIFIEKDATLLEINSLIRATDGTFTCIDAKFTFDNAAERRQPELFALRDSEHGIPDEMEAAKYGLVFVRMEGNIGNVVNGAGLAMATNDAIGLYGGTSANFLDAGGQATKETVLKAFAIIMRDERVKAILVNIYGGITDGRMIAESIIGAASELGPMRVPVVVRLQGTNSAEGLKMLEEANLGLYVEADFGEAAKRAVELARPDY